MINEIDLVNKTETLAVEKTEDGAVYISTRPSKIVGWTVARLSITQIPELIELLQKCLNQK